MNPARDHGNFEGVVPSSSAPKYLSPAVDQKQLVQKQPARILDFNDTGSLGFIIDKPVVTPAGNPSGQSACSLSSEEVDAFLENAARGGEEKDRGMGGRVLVVESETREELREALPYVAKINLPIVSSQRGGVAVPAVRDRRPQENQGEVDLDQVCPCTLQGHECCYPAGEFQLQQGLYHTLSLI